MSMTARSRIWRSPGRPAFARLRSIVNATIKASRREASTSAPALTRTTDVTMAQADWRFDGCWCKRVEVRPLSYDGKAIPKAAEARAALQKLLNSRILKCRQPKNVCCVWQSRHRASVWRETLANVLTNTRIVLIPLITIILSGFTKKADVFQRGVVQHFLRGSKPHVQHDVQG